MTFSSIFTQTHKSRQTLANSDKTVDNSQQQHQSTGCPEVQGPLAAALPRMRCPAASAETLERDQLLVDLASEVTHLRKMLKEQRGVSASQTSHWRGMMAVSQPSCV